MSWIVAFRSPEGEYHRWLDVAPMYVSDWPGDAHEFLSCHAAHKAIEFAERELTPRRWRGRWVGVSSAPFAREMVAA